jgi:MFS family permease
MYLGGGIVLYLLLASLGSASTALFALVCALIISFYGGGFATVPAYLRDLFGTYQVGAIHGRLLTAWSTAGILGPLIVNRVLDTRGTPGSLQSGDYRLAILIMVGVLGVGFVANLLIRPVSERWHEKSPVTDAADGAARPAARPDIGVEPEDIPIIEEETYGEGMPQKDAHELTGSRTPAREEDRL